MYIPVYPRKYGFVMWDFYIVDNICLLERAQKTLVGFILIINCLSHDYISVYPKTSSPWLIIGS